MIKFVSKLFFAALFVALGAFALSEITGCNPLTAFAGLGATSIVFGKFLKAQGIIATGLLTDVWTGELLAKFRHEDVSFMQGIQDYSHLVNNDVIKLVDIGVDPAVLINNTTYPISTAQRTDVDLPISLVKYDTENTTITEDELHGLPYDKEGSVLAQHQGALEEKTAEKSAHALSPTDNQTATPVLRTTGALVGAGATARRKLQVSDIIALQKKFNDLKVPKKGRRLVLCNAHVQDLLETSQTFERQYNDIAEGKPMPKLYSFEIHEFGYTVQYVDNGTTCVKKAFGAAAVAANDCDASFAFTVVRAMQAKGTVQIFSSKAADSPLTRASMFGLRLYHVCLPKKAEGIAAIVAAKS